MTMTMQSYLEDGEGTKSTTPTSKFFPRLKTMTAIKAEVRHCWALVVSRAEKMAKVLKAGARKQQKVEVKWISGATRLG